MLHRHHRTAYDIQGFESADQKKELSCATFAVPFRGAVSCNATSNLEEPLR